MLEIHLFGPSVGESIVLGLPDGTWGVVDCFRRRQTSPVVEWLKARDINSLRFLCWTHPHDDHSSGLPFLLAEFPQIDEFWHCDAMCQLSVLALIDTEHQRVYNGVSSYLVEVYESMLKRTTGPQPTSLVKHCRTSQPLLRLQQHDLKITVLTPSSASVATYETRLGKAFTEEVDFSALSPEPHNEVSVGLWMEYGKTSVILGGDAEVPTWERARAAARDMPWPSHSNYIKASHHGSLGAYDPELWAEWAPGLTERRVGVTPFSSQKLPRPEGLEKFAAHGVVRKTGTANRAISTEYDLAFEGFGAEIVASPLDQGSHYWIRMDDQATIVDEGYSDAGD